MVQNSSSHFQQLSSNKNSLSLQNLLFMSRERNSEKVNNRNLRGDLPHLKAQNLHLIKPKRTRGMGHPGKEVARNFDSREKYVKGDLKLTKKPFKKFGPKTKIKQNLSFKKTSRKLAKSENKETIV